MLEVSIARVRRTRMAYPGMERNGVPAASGRTGAVIYCVTGDKTRRGLGRDFLGVSLRGRCRISFGGLLPC